MEEQSNIGWGVVVVDGGRWEAAERNIAALGYEVDFLLWRKPVERRVLVDGKRCRDRGSASIVKRPLFAPYGFVLLPYGADAVDIDAAFGVSRLLRHKPKDFHRVGAPKRMRASIVERFRVARAAGEFDHVSLRPKPPTRTDLEPGTAVTMPWRSDGMVATVLQMDDEAGRAEYLINMLGGARGWFTKEETDQLQLAST